MFSIYRKEITGFFASSTGYVVISLFLIVNGLFLWVFDGEFNILNYGFADLSVFFQLAPWVLLLLIPAVTMKSFSEERNTGTLELLLTKPLGHWQIVIGKYLGALTIIVLAMLPTITYIITVWQLGSPKGNIDLGSTLGAYVGLLFLTAAYTAIGIFSSILSKNQIISFLSAVFICFFFYYGFEGLASVPFLEFLKPWIAYLGMKLHFDSVGRGLIDTRDIVYFLSVSFFFLMASYFYLGRVPKTKKSKKPFFQIGGYLLILILINNISEHLYKRFDLTHDERYTLSEASIQVIKKPTAPIIIDVLLEGDFPSGFKRLQAEIRQLLEEFALYNDHIKFSFVDPLENEKNTNEIISELNAYGLTSTVIPTSKGGKKSVTQLFPWAIAYQNNKSVKIPLLINNVGLSPEENINKSIAQLEYAFADAIMQLTIADKKKIAVLKGNGELDDKYLADFILKLRNYYQVAAFNMDSLKESPNKTLRNLKRFDAAIIAKPTEPFSENEKYVLDQYIMNGGKSLWLIDAVAADLDSLQNTSQSAIAFPKDLNLNDMLFKYGVRINYNLIQDVLSTPITVQTNGGEAPLEWLYSPIVQSLENHPINKNLNLVKLEFANTIDTLKNTAKKTVLLKSSDQTKVIGTPTEIVLNQFTEAFDENEFVSGSQILGVLIEGTFISAFKNRVKPFVLQEGKDDTANNKMIVIADGDIANYTYANKRPLFNGIDPWIKQVYGNKDFLINSMHYLMDDSGLIHIRSKEVSVAFLDEKKVNDERVAWQVVNIIAPLVILGLFALVFHLIRKRKYQF
ncbi:gliding motility-associated ABC transporter substrate-binding protein GldG [Leptobacterium sp. I13]|uniref:gliding motility-associated ABC transporter substrate-binding protein GldG n=1 Tax=Leptobacterium meishanense TaxID=3128904 RepID=UPI0030ED893F